MAINDTPLNREEIIEELKDINDLEKKNNTLTQQQIIRRKELLAILESLSSNYEQQIERQKVIIKLAEEINTTESANYALQQKKLELLELQKKLQEAIATENIVDAAELAKQIRDLQLGIEDIESSIKIGEGLAKTLGIDESKRNSLTFKLLNNPKEALKGVSQGLRDTLESVGGVKPAALMMLSSGIEALTSNLASKTVEITKAQIVALDTARTSFVAATGASTKYYDIITNVGEANRKYGISYAEAGKSLTALYENLNTFTKLSSKSQIEITATSAKLEKLGISGTNTAESIASLSTVMSVTETQAAKTVETFAAMGQAIGVSSGKMVTDFIAVKDQLSVFGSSMDKTFTDLAAQAKATGVEIKTLLGLANMFDTFEGAATQVGKLNAILGGPYLSAMAMIEETDPTKRIDMLRQAVNQAGVSFEQMSYYQKKAIIEAGGFADAEEAQRILSMSAGQYAQELQTQQASQEELNKAIERTQTIQQTFNMALMNLAMVVEPLVNLFGHLARAFYDVMSNEYVQYILGVIAVVGILANSIKIAAGAFMLLNAAFAANPFVAIILGIIALVVAIKALHDWLFKPHSPILMDTLIMLPIIFKSIGEAALMVAQAVGNTAMSFAQMTKEIDPLMLYTLAGGVIALGLAFTTLGANIFAMVGIAAFVFALYSIAEALNSIDTEKVVSFKTIMEKSVEVAEPENLKNFEIFAQKLQLATKATAEINANNTQVFTNMLTATQNVSQAIGMKQTVIVKIGNKEIEGMIDDRIEVKRERRTNPNTTIA
jgi:hypothetical protein